MIQLSQEEILKISQLCQSNKVRSLHAFGSVTREDFNPNSDIDLIVDFDLTGLGLRDRLLADDLKSVLLDDDLVDFVLDESNLDSSLVDDLEDDVSGLESDFDSNL